MWKVTAHTWVNGEKKLYAFAQGVTYETAKRLFEQWYDEGASMVQSTKMENS